MEVTRYEYDLTDDERAELSKILDILRSTNKEIRDLGIQIFLTSKIFDKLYHNKEKVWKYFYLDDYRVKINDIVLYGNPVHYTLLRLKMVYKEEEDIISVIIFLYSILNNIKCFYCFKD